MNQKNRFKFRFWDKLEKRFTYSESYGGKIHCFIGIDGSPINFQNGASGDEFIVNQYVGMKDVAGKEIYEGDIVNFAYNVNTQMECVVEWSQQFFCFILVHYNNDKLVFQSRLMKTNQSKMTIIGNKYENCN